MPPKSTPIEHRFWSKVDKSHDCWEWTAHRTHDGYGRFTLRHGVPRMAHRVAYELTHGTIPDGLLVCHRCDNPACVRPAHLFLGTNNDNMRDMVAKGRGHAGIRNIRAKLTPTQVKEIRTRATGKWGEQSRLGREYGVDHSTIARIIKGQTWDDP